MPVQKLSRALEVAPALQSDGASVMGFARSLGIFGTTSVAPLFEVATSAGTVLASGLVESTTPISANVPAGGVASDFSMVEQDTGVSVVWSAPSAYQRALKPLQSSGVFFGLRRDVAGVDGNTLVSGKPLVSDEGTSQIIPAFHVPASLSDAVILRGHDANVSVSGGLGMSTTTQAAPMFCSVSLLEKCVNTERHSINSKSPLISLVVIPEEAQCAVSSIATVPRPGDFMECAGFFDGNLILDSAYLDALFPTPIDAPGALPVYISGYGEHQSTLQCPTHKIVCVDGMHIDRDDYRTLVHTMPSSSPSTSLLMTSSSPHSQWKLCHDMNIALALSEVDTEYTLRASSNVEPCAAALGFEGHLDIFNALGSFGMEGPQHHAITSPGMVSPHDAFIMGRIEFGSSLETLPRSYELVRHVGPQSSSRHVVNTFDIAEMLLARNPHIARLAQNPGSRKALTLARMNMPRYLDLSASNQQVEPFARAHFEHFRGLHTSPILHHALETYAVDLRVETKPPHRFNVSLGDAICTVDRQAGTLGLTVRESEVVVDMPPDDATTSPLEIAIFSSQPANQTVVTVTTIAGVQASAFVPLFVRHTPGTIWGNVQSSAAGGLVSATGVYRGSMRKDAFQESFDMVSGEQIDITLPSTFALQASAHIARLHVSTGSGVVSAHQSVNASVLTDASWIIHESPVRLACTGGPANVSLTVCPSRAVMKVAMEANTAFRAPATLSSPVPADHIALMTNVGIDGVLQVGMLPSPVDKTRTRKVSVDIVSNRSSTCIAESILGQGESIRFGTTVQDMVKAGVLAPGSSDEDTMSIFFTVDEGTPTLCANVACKTTAYMSARIVDLAGKAHVHSVRDSNTFEMSIV